MKRYSFNRKVRSLQSALRAKTLRLRNQYCLDNPLPTSNAVRQTGKSRMTSLYTIFHNYQCSRYNNIRAHVNKISTKRDISATFKSPDRISSRK